MVARRCGAPHTSGEGPRRPNRSSFRQTVGVLGTLNLPSVETTTVSDSGNTFVVLVVTGLLVLAGVALAALGVWYWRSTIPDPDSLGPLHSMSSRAFVGLDDVERRRRLDVMRPSLADELVAVRRSKRTTNPAIDAVDSPDPVGDDAVAHPTAVDAAPVDQRAEVVANTVRGADWVDDESWPGDDWSDLEGWGESDAEDSPDVVVEEWFDEPTPPRRPSIDPLIG